MNPRRPFQGVTNILRFNWHFFAAATLVAAAVALAAVRLQGAGRLLALIFVAGVVVTSLVSLLVSCWVYDLSGLYDLEWLARTGVDSRPGARMANIHAGFDETTDLLRARYPKAEWTVMDFYDPARHTEVSIRRARRAYPPSPDDQRVATADLPLPADHLDAVFLILAAHEVRDDDERRRFFAELRRVLAPGGRVVVLEHLRDGRNFLAYTLGAFHFIGRRAWLTAFDGARLRPVRTFAPNPFLTCFVLEKE